MMEGRENKLQGHRTNLEGLRRKVPSQLLSPECLGTKGTGVPIPEVRELNNNAVQQCIPQVGSFCAKSGGSRERLNQEIPQWT